MNREEAIRELKIQFVGEYDRQREAKDMAIQALEQEPCEDEYIKVPKKALKYRTAGMVAYNAEWLKDNFDIERAVICGAQEPQQVRTQMSSADCISRQAALKELKESAEHHANDSREEALLRRDRDIIRALPSVKPQTGHWIVDECVTYCSKCGCGALYDKVYPGESVFGKAIRVKSTFCPTCGAKMIKPES